MRHVPNEIMIVNARCGFLLPLILMMDGDRRQCTEHTSSHRPALQTQSPTQSPPFPPLPHPSLSLLMALPWHSLSHPHSRCTPPSGCSRQIRLLLTHSYTHTTINTQPQTHTRCAYTHIRQLCLSVTPQLGHESAAQQAQARCQHCLPHAIGVNVARRAVGRYRGGARNLNQAGIPVVWATRH